jgi:hypothetical protein
VAAGISGEDALALAEELGDEVAAGVYFDRGAERMVVAVTEPEATETVIEAGSLVDVVEHSTAELDAIHEAFGAEFDVPDLAWGVDVLNNQVTITAGPLVSAADLAAIEDFAAGHGTAVAVETTDSSFAPRIRGGDKINPRAFADPYGNCSLGFNVRDKDNPNSLSFVTAGHCTVPTVEAGNRDWVNSGNVYIGYTTGGFFPGNDFGLVRHNNASIAKPGNVDIDDAGHPQHHPLPRRLRRRDRLHQRHVVGLQLRLGALPERLHQLLRLRDRARADAHQRLHHRRRQRRPAHPRRRGPRPALRRALERQLRLLLPARERGAGLVRRRGLLTLQ